MEDSYKKQQRKVQEKKDARSLPRRLLIVVLGGKCSCNGDGCWHDGPCGITDLRCLQLDHVNSDGAVERRRLGGGKAEVTYYYNHPAEVKSKLQVLCANCNWVKRSSKGEDANYEMTAYRRRLDNGHRDAIANLPFWQKTGGLDKESLWPRV